MLASTDCSSCHDSHRKEDADTSPRLNKLTRRPIRAPPRPNLTHPTHFYHSDARVTQHASELDRETEAR